MGCLGAWGDRVPAMAWGGGGGAAAAEGDTTPQRRALLATLEGSQPEDSVYQDPQGSHMQMIPPLWQKVRGTKEPLDEGERGEGKSWLKIQQSKN